MINPSTSPSQLANYPFLFVKESKSSAEYYCTLCESYIPEKDHKSHLFEGVHKGQTLGDFFVRTEGPSGSSKGNPTFVCVICWSKLSSAEDIPFHRNTCSSSTQMPSSSSLEQPSEGKVSEDDEDEYHRKVPEEEAKNPSPAPTRKSLLCNTSSRRRKQMQPQQHISVLPAVDEETSNGGEDANCFQCSLCSVLLPSTISYISHLKTFHRIASNAFDKDSNCPLCLASISLLDLSDHLISGHGLVPQTAVNSLILWVLTNFSKQMKTYDDMEGHDLSSSLSSKKPALSNPLLGLPQPPTLLPPLQVSGASLPSQQHLLAAAILMNGGNMEGIASSATLANLQHPQVGEFNDNNNNSPHGKVIGSVASGKVSLSSIVGKLSRTHVSNNKQSFQCFLCAKWFALLPVKHMKLHILKFKQEKLKMTSLINGQVVCLSCYALFGSQSEAARHFEKVHEKSRENSPHELITSKVNYPLDLSDGSGGDPPMSLPLSLTMTVGPPLNLEDGGQVPVPVPVPPPTFPHQIPRGVELDNAGRVKSGKVRKQCELCGEWSNIKWFFKHMSEVHQALFCRCCREYLPIPEQEDHRRWHAEPPYMGQKIRIENGQPIIIDRKERASLTPIGSLAPWGGSSGGMVVKAIDEANGNGASVQAVKKRKPYGGHHLHESPVKMMNLEGPLKVSNYSGAVSNGCSNNTKDTLMPKETCPVCGILITYKNLARHIKLRHKIKYKFCHKCRKLVPNNTYDAHKASHSLERGPASNQSPNPLNLITNEVSIVPTSVAPPLPSTVEAEPVNKPDISRDLMDLTLDTVGKTLEADPCEDEDQSEGSPLGDGRKSESFRANTSKTKLESLLGKEFKHPRRKCALCGYSVSYSNFKRHLRNAHLSEYLEVQNNPGAFKKALQTLALESEDLNALGGSEDDFEDDFDEEDEDEFSSEKVDCPECGDHLLEEFLPHHMKSNHPQKEEESPPPSSKEEAKCEQSTLFPDSPTNNHLICPFCSLASEDPESLNKHTKAKHKTSIKWCEPCAKYVSKKTFKSHLKSHIVGAANNETADDDSLLLIDEDGESNKNNNVFTCPHCHKIFLAPDAYQTHLTEKHANESEPELPTTATEQQS